MRTEEQHICQLKLSLEDWIRSLDGLNGLGRIKNQLLQKMVISSIILKGMKPRTA